MSTRNNSNKYKETSLQYYLVEDKHTRRNL